MSRKKRRHANKIREESGRFDAIVRTGPDCSETVTTVRGLVERYKGEMSAGCNMHYTKALRNERYFHGLQARDGLQSLDATAVDSYRNYLRNMVQTWASRSQEDRPIIKAYPMHPEATDYHSSKVANAILQDIHRREGMDAKLWEAAVYAQLHGKVGFKVTWNPDAGADVIVPKVDPETGVVELDDDGNELKENLGPQGEVQVDLVTIFDYDYGGSTDAHDADWVMFTSYENEVTARGMLRAELGRGVDSVDVTNYSNASGIEMSGVEINELWVRPNYEIPRGLYALVVGGQVAIAMDHPYEHGMLPICEWKVNPIRNSRFATSHVDDAVPVQQLINELEEAKVETVRKTGVPRLLAVPSVAQSIEEGSHIIEVDDQNTAVQGAHYLNPPNPSPLVFDHQGEATQGMYDIFGLNEVLVGKDSVKSGTSAKQIAYLSRLDSMKMSGPTRNFEVAYLRMSRMEIALTRQYVKQDRLVRIVGDGGELSVFAFRGADLDGYDVHLEPNSGMEKFRAQETMEANQDLQTGKISLEEGIERSETGLSETLSDGRDRTVASRMVSLVMQGGRPDPDTSINPKVALQVIKRSLGISPRIDKQLLELAKFYEDAIRRVSAPSGPGAVGPQQRANMVPKVKARQMGHSQGDEPMVNKERP